MARPKKIQKTARTRKSRTTVEKPSSNDSILNRIQDDLENKNAILNLVLGALIIIVGGILVFNYFNKSKTEITTNAPQTENTANQDVSKESLPGNYTVKEGDTLFSIAQKYYDDGYQYPKLVQANKLSNENAIAAGQVLTIPKLLASATSSPSTDQANAILPSTSPSPSSSPTSQENLGTGGATNVTTWGEKIETDTYTVQPGDWLSKIAGRAYGDIYAFQKIAQANNITNPDVIEPGTVLKIPR